MRIGVTGAGGFTGRYVMPALVARGHDAVALEADLTEPEAVAAEIERWRPEAVIHLAGQAFVAAERFEAFYQVNQLGTFHLLDALATHVPGASVVLASSAQVYGGNVSGLLAEDAAFAPGNHYALSKAAMEWGSALWRDRLRVTIARPFNYSGIGQEVRYLVPKLVNAFRRRLPDLALGNTMVERDIGDVRAVAAAYVRLAELAPGTAVNISTGHPVSVDAVIARLSELTGHRIAITVDQRLVRPGEPARLGGDNARLRALAPDWSPMPLDDTLAWMLAD